MDGVIYAKKKKKSSFGADLDAQTRRMYLYM